MELYRITFWYIMVSSYVNFNKHITILLEISY